jgi:hypothetical protein
VPAAIDKNLDELKRAVRVFGVTVIRVSAKESAIAMGLRRQSRFVASWVEDHQVSPRIRDLFSGASPLLPNKRWSMSL